VLQRALAAQEAVTESLLGQLKAKDAQIEGMQTFMQSLNERLRESNLLMASLQKQLPGPASSDGELVVAKSGERQSTKANADNGSKTKGNHGRGWWRGVFGRRSVR
jgi:ABC-type transporter Mla subunit MlaD